MTRGGIRRNRKPRFGCPYQAVLAGVTCGGGSSNPAIALARVAEITGPAMNGSAHNERKQLALARIVPQGVIEAKKNFRNFYSVHTASPPMAFC
jgi:hypothetical protein